MDHLKTSSLDIYLEKIAFATINNLPFFYHSYQCFNTNFQPSVKVENINHKPGVDILGISLVSYRNTLDLYAFVLKQQKLLTCDSHLLIMGFLSWPEHSEYELQTQFWSKMEQALIDSSWKHLVLQHTNLDCNYSSIDNYREDYSYFSRKNSISSEASSDKKSIKLVSFYAQGFDEKKSIKITLK